MEKVMVSYAGLRPPILTAAEADLQREEAEVRLAERRIKPPSRGSGGVMAYTVATLVLIVVGYLLFSNNWNTMSMFPTVTETLPAPDINSSISPDTPMTPPAAAPKNTQPVAP
jgi:hypothetical protein